MADREPDQIRDNEPQQEAEEPQEDFASLFEASERSQDMRIHSDTKVEGAIVSIGEEWVFVDIGAKSEGTIAREELLDDKGEFQAKVGDPVTAYVVSTREGEILLSRKMTAAASDDAIRGAHRSGVPVEGLVTGERKGGYSVSVFGKPAFCPYSQMELKSAGMPSDYVGKRFTFRIAEFSDRGRNLVLSRREILEEERLKLVAQLKKTLKPGDEVQGTVQKLAHFGAFVDIGGIEGLIPMSELAWYRVGEAAEVLREGELVTIRILDLDWDHNRISLSLKQTLEDPWSSVSQRYAEETSLTGKVTKLMNFGAFVQLEPGVEGLIHISHLGMGRRINHPKEAVSEGDEVQVRIISVDQAARRIGLELVFQGSEEEGSAQPELREGDVVTGTVDSIKDYGVFVSLPGGKSGLLHVSEIGDRKTGDLRNRFQPGSSVEVQILGVDAESKKISLSTKSLSRSVEQSQFKEFATEKGGTKSLGTLGDLLKDKIKG
ncbi:MAG: S1 RNA-binding domain-containing protein [Desulfomonilaceae bacterium]